MPNEKFIEYARPLIEGEVKYPIEGGLPKYITLEKMRVEKKLPSRESTTFITAPAPVAAPAV
jgi:hypothetical protein